MFVTSNHQTTNLVFFNFSHKSQLEQLKKKTNFLFGCITTNFMGCLPLVVTTHFCLTRGSKRSLNGTDRSAIWWWSERHLTVLCIDEIVPSYVVVQLNWSKTDFFLRFEPSKSFFSTAWTEKNSWKNWENKIRSLVFWCHEQDNNYKCW